MPIFDAEINFDESHTLQRKVVELTVSQKCYLQAIYDINEIVSDNPEHTSLSEIIEKIKEYKSKAYRYDLLMARSDMSIPFNIESTKAV